MQKPLIVIQLCIALRRSFRPHQRTLVVPDKNVFSIDFVNEPLSDHLYTRFVSIYHVDTYDQLDMALARTIVSNLSPKKLHANYRTCTATNVYVLFYILSRII